MQPVQLAGLALGPAAGEVVVRVNHPKPNVCRGRLAHVVSLGLFLLVPFFSPDLSRPTPLLHLANGLLVCWESHHHEMNHEMNHDGSGPSDDLLPGSLTADNEPFE